MAADSGWRFGRDEALTMTALVVAFAAWQAPLPLPASLLGLALAVALATWRLDLATALAPLTFPFTFQPRLVGAQQIAPAEAAVVVLALALVGRVGLSLLRRAPPRWDWSPAWLVWPAVALLGVATVSLATVADPSHLRESLVEYRKVIVQPLLYGLVCWVALRRPRDRWLALTALGVAGAAIGLLAAGQVLLGLAGVAAEGVRRAVGPYQHPNNLALFTGRCVALGAALGLAWPHWGGRALALALAAGAAVGLLASFSRGGWFAALVSVGLLALLLGRRRLAATLAGGVAALLILLPRTGIERLNRLLDSDGGSGALRLDLWRSTAAMIADHPVTGVGLDQFLYQYNPRYVAPAAWAERFTAHPHNLVLDFWVRLGIAGLVTGAALYGLTLATAVRLVRQTTAEARALAAGAGALMLYGLLHGLVDASFFLPDLALIFWLAAVVLAHEDRRAAGAAVLQ